MRSPQPTSAMEPSDTIELKPDLLAQAPVEDGRDERAALADERDPAACGAMRRRERGVEAGDRAHDAQAVGADDAHAVPPWPASTSCRSSAAPSGPTSLKPAEMTTADGDAGLAALLDDPGDARRRRHDDREVDLLRDGATLGWLWMPRMLRPLGVDGVDGAAERAGDEVGEDRAAHAAGLLRRADEGHGPGLEERPKRAACTGPACGSRP